MSNRKPKDCPFCGGLMSIYFDQEEEMFLLHCQRCSYTSAKNQIKRKSIAAHNRICKAVEAYNESEVK